jgi:hypothetical protein
MCTMYIHNMYTLHICVFRQIKCYNKIVGCRHVQNYSQNMDLYIFVVNYNNYWMQQQNY